MKLSEHKKYLLGSFNRYVVLTIIIFISPTTWGSQESTEIISPDGESSSAKQLRILRETEFKRLGWSANMFLNPSICDRLGIDQVIRDSLGNDQQSVEKYIKDCKENILKTPSYEESIGYSIFLEKAKVIEDAIHTFDKNYILNRTLIGTAPLGFINAQTIYNPADRKYIIVFDQGLFVFALLLSKTVALALPLKNDPVNVSFSTDKQDIINHIKADPKAVIRFRELLNAYIFEDDPSRAPRYAIEFPRDRPTSAYMNAFELFVIGHEYGHTLIRDEKIPAGNSELALTSAQEEELYADRIGLQLSAIALRKQNTDHSASLAGATLFFISDEIIWKVISVLRNGFEKPYPTENTHPNPRQRMTKLRQATMGLLGLSSADAERTIQLSELMEWIIDTLWNENRSYFEQMYQRGRKPHVLWDKIQ